MLTAEAYEARKKDFLAYKDTLVKEPTGESVKKEYYVGCFDKNDWEFIHEELKKDGSFESNIPSGSCEVVNDCLHSGTTGLYLLNDIEVASLRNHSKVKYVSLNVSAYPGTYLENPDDLKEHNGGKDIKIGDDKRPVSIIPKEQQLLYDFATGAVLVDEFGVPLLSEEDAIFVPDATAERSTSIVIGDTESTFDRDKFDDIAITDAVYGDYDVSITSSIQGLDVGNPTTTGILTVLPQSGNAINCGTGGSLKIKQEDNTIITHDQWPYLDVRTVEERGPTNDSGTIIPRITNKIYVPDHVGITSILGVQSSESDPLTNKKFLVTGKYLKGNVRIVKVAYNSRLTLAKQHTVNDEILGLTSTIPISIDSNSVVTVTLNDHGFLVGDRLHIKIQAEKSGSATIILNTNYEKSYAITEISNNAFTFVHDHSSSLNSYGGRVFIKQSTDSNLVSDSFRLQKTDEADVSNISKTRRYADQIKHKRDIEGGSGISDYIPTTPDVSLLNRGSWQLRRHQQKVDPWTTPSDILTNRAHQYATGKDVDLIVCDEDMWFGHIEFQNPSGITNVKSYDNSTSVSTVAPENYVGGNALKSGFSISAPSATTGSCDLLDLVLEGPYYLDPDFFEANPSARLEPRWDGTKVPKEGVARAWWTTNRTTSRSARFVSPSQGGTASGDNDFGTISVPNDYTRAVSNGYNDAHQTGSGYHGTPCASQAYGRQYGWAYNANKWFLNLYGTNSIGFKDGFDIQKIFHKIKPINSKYGNKNPTISSNSWAIRFSRNTGGGYYYYQKKIDGTESGVEFTSWNYTAKGDGSGGAAPRFMTHFHQDRIRMEPQSGAILTAGDELIESGIIFVCSAGNTRQKLVKGGHPDFKNYFSNNAYTAIDGDGSIFESGAVTYAKTINRTGLPGAIGKSGSGDSTEYNTIQVGALDDDHDGDGKERKVNYSNMGNAVDFYAAAKNTLAAGDNSYSNGVLVPHFNRYDAYYSIGGLQSLESEDTIFGGTSAACPIAAGLIATKLEHFRSATTADLKTWLSRVVGEQNADDFHFGSEILEADGAEWGEDDSNLHGGSAKVIWDTKVGGIPLPSFRLNGVSYTSQFAFNPGDTFPATGSFSDRFITGKKQRVFINQAIVKTNESLSVGVGSVHLSKNTDNDGRSLITSGKYSYAKQLSLEISTPSGSDIGSFDDLTLSTNKGLFYQDAGEVYYTLDKRINKIKIKKVESKPVKSDVVLKVEEVFPESSEVSTTLLGVNRAETQLSLFSNVSTYGLESKDWEVIDFRGTITLREWEERINAIYGKRTRGEVLEETQESAIKLNIFPAPNTFPFGPNFEKNNLYQSDTFELYAKFIDMGNDLYNYYNEKDLSEYGGDASVKQRWLKKFLNPEIAYAETGTKRDVIYKAEIKDAFAAIDTWTETYRDIKKNELKGSPISEDPGKMGYTEINLILKKSGTDEYSNSTTRPGYSDTPQRYILLQSRRVFRYQPGRISGFTFGVRAAREFVSGMLLEWGIYNKTDHYVFQVDGGFIKIIRRSKVQLPPELFENYGEFVTQELVKSPDPVDSLESEDNPAGNDYELHELVIPQDMFNGDPLNGRGASGHTVLPQNITMWKIEFGWYGAIGARFYAYIPAGNGEARWVTLHTLIIENQIGKPCLVDPYFRFRYMTKIFKTTDIRTPQFVYKYGASYYIDGGDEGTTSQNSIKTESDSGRAGVGIGNTAAILGIRPKAQIFNSTGVPIKNKKIIIPTQLNMTTNALTKVQVGVCTGCPGWAHVHTQGFRRNGTDNSSFLGRSMPIEIRNDNEMTPFYEGDNAIYFTKQDIGAKIIAPSIYNCYITDVGDIDDPGISGKRGDDGAVGFNSYTKATIQGFEGHRSFAFGTGGDEEGRTFNGDRALDRSVNPPVRINLPNSTDGLYRSEASKQNGTTKALQAQPVRLSNYDGLAISDYELSGSRIDIQFTVPRSPREGGFDPTWGYSHWADALVGVTDVTPYSDGTGGAEFDIEWNDIDVDGNKVPEPSTSGIRTDFLPNNKILFAEHTHAWAASDVSGADSRESWPVFQFRSRLGLDQEVATLTGIATGRCGRVKIEVGEPQFISGVKYTNKNPKTNEVDSPEKLYLVSSEGGLTTIDINAYDGGQVAYKVGTSSIIRKESNVTFVGIVSLTDPPAPAQPQEFIEISGELTNASLTDPPTEIILALRRVDISTEFRSQMNNSSKIFKFDVFPLYPLIKLKDYGEINNVSIKEVIGETQVTTSPRFYVNRCEINTYGDKVTVPTGTTSNPPTNFKSVSKLSGAEFDNQNKCQIRDFVQKDVFYVGRDQTQSIDLSKIFSQDKEVITADSNNQEATFVIASDIDPDPDNVIDAEVQASVNFKEQ